MDTRDAEKLRDKRLRAKLLFVLHEGRAMNASGLMSARFLKDQAASLGEGFEDDEHALSLMRDLKLSGFAIEHQKTRRVGQRFSLDFCEFGITAAGVQQHLQDAAKHSLIEDDRIE